MKDNLPKILQNYLRRENYNLDHEDFQLQLKSNPNYPSIKSVTDALDYFQIENITAIVPKTALPQLPTFFIAVIKEGYKIRMAQITKTRKGLSLFNDDGSKQKLTEEEFLDVWTGKIVAIENKEKEKQSLKVSFSNPLIPAILLVLGSITIGAINLDWAILVYSCFAALGGIMSYYIVQEDLGIYNEATAKLCNSAATNTSCSDVVSSKSAKLLNAISLSDLSITFFISTLIILSAIGYNETFFFGLAIVSTPVIIYSIYVQAFSIKKWCPLCLGVALMIAGMATTSFLTVGVFTYPLGYFTKSLAVFGIVYLAWVYLKSLIQKSLDLQKVTTDYFKFKRNEGLFANLLSKKMLPGIIDLDESSKLTFGNPDAALTINAVTSPSCGHCTKSFQVYDELLNTNGDHFKLNIIFSVNVTTADNPGRQVSQKIIELYQENSDKAYRALKNWYGNKNLEDWQSIYGISSDEFSLSILRRQLDWCMANEIKGTPATAIGNYLFPIEYDIENLPFLIDDLIENGTEILKEASII